MKKIVLLLILFLFISMSSLFATESDVSTTVQIQPETVLGMNQFALDMYQQVKNQQPNIFYSPFSLTTALGMTAAGAKGETRDEMLQTLHLKGTDKAIHSQLSAVISHFNQLGVEGKINLSVANALWGEKSIEFNSAYLSFVKKMYDAGLVLTDFKNAAETARLTINKWVEDKTNQKIKDLIPAGLLQSDTRLVLTNAIYFKGDWLTEFLASATHDSPFDCGDETTVTVPLMYAELSLPFAELEGTKIVKLPYQGNSLSMLVMLPAKKSSFKDFVTELTVEKILNWSRTLQKEKVKVYLPRFELTSKFKMGELLEKMGMKKAFSGEADFSLMTKNEKLSISEVLHKAYVKVNEQGTEAAAATAVIMRKSMSLDAPVVPVFRADHPFLFVILDEKTETFLFLGQLQKPEEN